MPKYIIYIKKTKSFGIISIPGSIGSFYVKGGLSKIIESSQICTRRETGVFEKTLGVRMSLTNLSPCVEPKTLHWFVEVGSTTDDHYIYQLDLSE